jgi:hypothetical protein
MKLRVSLILFWAMVLTFTSVLPVMAQNTTDAAPAKESVLKSDEVGGKLFPDKVFFRGQSASVQARNSGGVRYGDGFLVIGALVDSSGYASGLKEKYQGYLMTEVPIEISGQTLKPGAYGFGFIEGSKFVVMDLGANDLLQISSVRDNEMKRPVPLQFVAGSAPGTYRLYKGRDYVEFHRVK